MYDTEKLFGSDFLAYSQRIKFDAKIIIGGKFFFVKVLLNLKIFESRTD